MKTKILFLGKILDSNIEHELFSTNEFGLTAKVKFKDGREQNYNNLSEIHYAYNITRLDEPRVAFESGLHHTGGTEDIATIEQIEIVEATEMADAW